MSGSTTYRNPHENEKRNAVASGATRNQRAFRRIPQIPKTPHSGWPVAAAARAAQPHRLRDCAAMGFWWLSILLGYLAGALAIAPSEMDAHCWGTAALLAHGSLSDNAYSTFDLFIFVGVMTCHRVLMAAGAASWRGICERRN